MIVYHVCGISKLDHYRQLGHINPPVRAWKTPEEAARFSRQTGRPIILRLKFPDDAQQLDGHRGMAVFIEQQYDVRCLLGNR